MQNVRFSVLQLKVESFCSVMVAEGEYISRYGSDLGSKRIFRMVTEHWVLCCQVVSLKGKDQERTS